MPLYNKSDLINERLEKSVSDSDHILVKEASEFNEIDGYDIFLSHSYKDASVILNLKRDIETLGFSIYVDWVEDSQLDRTNVTPTTADIIRKRIDSSRCLIYVPSENSMNSKWMPWELGYADGSKDGKVAILPISDSYVSTSVYRGREYLGLYCYITRDKIHGTEIVALWVRRDERTFVKLEDWLKGKQPVKKPSIPGKALL